MSDEVKKIHMKFEREDVPTTVRKRWNYFFFIKHVKWTIGGLIVLVILFIAGFPYVITQTDLHTAWGLLGFVLLIWRGVKGIFLAWWFITSRAYFAYLLPILVYPIIKRFIHSERVGLRELGAKNTHFFKITTLADGYLLHEDKFFGLRKTPIFLDKVTVQYFKEHGTERVIKEKGKRDDSYLEVDVVPLSWRGDSLLITDEETKKRFLNNAVLVNKHIRDYYSIVVKGFSPTNREVEKGVIYDEILGTSDLKKENIQLRRDLKNVDIDHLYKVAEVVIPHSSDEMRRFKGVVKESTKDYDKTTEKIEQKTAVLELVKKEDGTLTEEELTALVSAKEID